MNWSELNRIQIGKYAEYFVKMEFSKYKEFNVFTAEVDDRGIDFVLRYEDSITKNYKHFDIQVKSFREAKSSYIFIPKSKFYLNQCYFVALVRFVKNEEPYFYLIPATAWKKSNDLFRDREYDKKGQKSQPEYGLNVSRKNISLLEKYKFELTIEKIINSAI